MSCALAIFTEIGSKRRRVCPTPPPPAAVAPSEPVTALYTQIYRQILFKVSQSSISFAHSTPQEQHS